jgi:ribosomal protein S18 acetylase RimI-like enzyme
MATLSLHDKEDIEGRLRRNPELNLYGLGDLDDVFWPHTVWFGEVEEGVAREVVLIYTAFAVPVLIALSEDPPAMARLVSSIRHLLPRKFYTHLSPGVEDALLEAYSLESYGRFHRMALRDLSPAEEADTSGVVPLGAEHLDEIHALYWTAYPGCWFDPAMVDTGEYFGVRRGGALVCIAGVHLVSERYGVAAMGNIATHPQHRGKGYATAATARLCRSLREKVRVIGLNVQVDNEPAVSIYQKLGFDVVADYGEYMAELRPERTG